MKFGIRLKPVSRFLPIHIVRNETLESSHRPFRANPSRSSRSLKRRKTDLKIDWELDPRVFRRSRDRNRVRSRRHSARSRDEVTFDEEERTDLIRATRGTSFEEYRETSSTLTEAYLPFCRELQDWSIGSTLAPRHLHMCICKFLGNTVNST